MIDKKIASYIERLIAFNPGQASDSERAEIIADGVMILEEKVGRRPRSMAEIIDSYAKNVNTESVPLPDYIVNDAALTRESVRDIIESRKATQEAYQKGAIAIVTSLFKLAAVAI